MGDSSALYQPPCRPWHSGRPTAEASPWYNRAVGMGTQAAGSKTKQLRPPPQRPASLKGSPCQIQSSEFNPRKPQSFECGHRARPARRVTQLLPPRGSMAQTGSSRSTTYVGRISSSLTVMPLALLLTVQSAGRAEDKDDDAERRDLRMQGAGSEGEPLLPHAHTFHPSILPFHANPCIITPCAATKVSTQANDIRVRESRERQLQKMFEDKIQEIRTDYEACRKELQVRG